MSIQSQVHASVIFHTRAVKGMNKRKVGEGWKGPVFLAEGHAYTVWIVGKFEVFELSTYCISSKTSHHNRIQFGRVVGVSARRTPADGSGSTADE